ncbi:hypothetical protein F4859DRAFT_311077 [Xylaria cf. heliscus]|nr:hypothetical protein F4859DRAFT_311077 [Xylaria cf. heliscus]
MPCRYWTKPKYFQCSYVGATSGDRYCRCKNCVAYIPWSRPGVGLVPYATCLLDHLPRPFAQGTGARWKWGRTLISTRQPHAAVYMVLVRRSTEGVSASALLGAELGGKMQRVPHTTSGSSATLSNLNSALHSLTMSMPAGAWQPVATHAVAAQHTARAPLSRPPARPPVQPARPGSCAARALVGEEGIHSFSRNGSPVARQSTPPVRRGTLYGIPIASTEHRRVPPLSPLSPGSSAWPALPHNLKSRCTMPISPIPSCRRFSRVASLAAQYIPRSR